MIEKVIAAIDARQAENVERLNGFLRIPSISTDPARKGDVRKAAEWVHELFAGCKIKSRIVDTPGHPSVLADTGPAGDGAPTVLVYGHYDVQPTGDEKLSSLSTWMS